MTALVRIALSRPYTFVVLALLLLIIGPLAALRTPTDIFPDIRIPVIGVVWQYTGLPPDQMAGRIITQFQRILTTTVNDIEHITANSYNGIGIVKIFFQPNVDIRTANAQVTAVSQTIIKQMPPGATPPLILNYSASTVPIVQLALSGEGLTEQKLADIAINQLRTPLVTVPGAAIPYPYGGKQRQIQIDLNPAALQALGPVGSGRRQRACGAEPDHAGGHLEDRRLRIRHSAQQFAAEDRRTRRSADQGRQRRHGLYPGRRHRARRQSAADQHRPRQRQSLRADDGAEGGLHFDARHHRRHQAEGHRLQGFASGDAQGRVCRRPVAVRPRRSIAGVVREGVIAALLTSVMILLFLGSWRSTIIIATSIPLAVFGSIIMLAAIGETLNIMTLGGLALAVGILVDEATVTIENINWHLEQGKDVEPGDPGRCQADRGAGLRVAVLHLHRVRADVLPARRCRASCSCRWPKR